MALLEPLHLGEYAEWAHLFTGLAEVRRYEQAVEAYETYQLSLAEAALPPEPEQTPEVPVESEVVAEEEEEESVGLPPWRPQASARDKWKR